MMSLQSPLYFLQHVNCFYSLLSGKVKNCTLGLPTFPSLTDSHPRRQQCITVYSANELQSPGICTDKHNARCFIHLRTLKRHHYHTHTHTPRDTCSTKRPWKINRFKTGILNTLTREQTILKLVKITSDKHQYHNLLGIF